VKNSVIFCGVKFAVYSLTWVQTNSTGLIKIEHGSGVHITGARPSTFLFSHFQQAGEGLLLEPAESWRILEPELAFLATEQGTDNELLEIETLVR